MGGAATTRTLGAVLYDAFELLDLCGPLEMFGNVGPELRIVTVADAPGPVATSSGVSAGTDMALAIIARLYGRERAEAIAALTEYEWQDDPSRDPFHKYLNQGDAGQLLAGFKGSDSNGS